MMSIEFFEFFTLKIHIIPENMHKNIPVPTVKFNTFNNLNIFIFEVYFIISPHCIMVSNRYHSQTVRLRLSNNFFWTQHTIRSTGVQMQIDS